MRRRPPRETDLPRGWPPAGPLLLFFFLRGERLLYRPCAADPFIDFDEGALSTPRWLWPDGAVVVRLIPPCQAHLLNVLAGLRGIDHGATAHVHADMTIAVEEEQVTGLELRLGHRRIPGGGLRVGGAWEGDPGRRPRRLDQPGAVIAAAVRAGRASATVDVRRAVVENHVGERDRLPRLGVGRDGIRRRRGAACTDGGGRNGGLLLHGQRGQDGLLAVDVLAQGLLARQPLFFERGDRGLGPARHLLPSDR